MVKIPTLDAGTIVLRPLTSEDAPAVFKYSSDNQVCALTQWNSHATIEDTRRFIYNNQNKTFWGIVDKESGALIGECGLIKREATVYELHRALAKPFWGKGLATQAMTTLTSYGFDELKVSAIQSLIIAENVLSIRLAQKIGMQHMMTLPHAWQSEQGLHDIYLFVLERS